MLIEIEITNPARPASRFAPIEYTARVYVSPERRKEIIDIPFPDRRAARRCHCENGNCQIDHLAGGCQSSATTLALYGALCDACAEWMPPEFLREQG